MKSYGGIGTYVRLGPKTLAVFARQNSSNRPVSLALAIKPCTEDATHGYNRIKVPIVS